MADKFSISLNKVDEVMREAIARGVTKASDLFQAVVDYIKDKFDIFGDEEEMVLKRAVMECTYIFLQKISRNSKFRQRLGKTDKFRSCCIEGSCHGMYV